MTSASSRKPSLAEGLAFLGIALLILVVPITKDSITIGAVRVDASIVGTAVAVLLAIPMLVREGVAALPKYGIEIPALAFLGIATISVFGSVAPADSMLTLARYLGYIALVFLVGMVARDDGRRRLLMWLMAIAALLTTCWAFLQWMYPPDAATVRGMFGMPSSIATRVNGPLGNSNFYGEYLVLALGVILALVLVERGTLKVIAGAILGVVSLTLLLTFTRGSWIAAFAGITIAIAMTKPKALWALFGALAAAVLVVPGVLERVLSIGSSEGTAGFRMRLWQITGAVIEDHPITGVGVGQFLTGFRKIVLERPELNNGYLEYGAHNSYFTLAAETGILGGLAFLWLTFAIVRQGFFLWSRDVDDRAFKLVNAGLTASLLGFALNAFTSNAFQHPRGAVFFFVIAGLQAGLGMRYWAVPQRAAAPIWQPKPSGVIGQSFVGRGIAAVLRFFGGAWVGSDVRGLLLRRARFDGELVGSSALRFLGVRRPGTAADDA